MRPEIHLLGNKPAACISSQGKQEMRGQAHGSTVFLPRVVMMGQWVGTYHLLWQAEGVGWRGERGSFYPLPAIIVHGKFSLQLA